MKQDATFFETCEPRLVYIARRLTEAVELEKQLSAAGFDYGVEADRYRGGLIFQTERVGAFFYVTPETEMAVREFLQAQGYRPAPVEGMLR